ncbi:MAG: S-layer homology domain-containing protein [Desulfovibrionales bacterium]|nr:S-layer homology domain-containing protein [Desulfovibrionales bacterium]
MKQSLTIIAVLCVALLVGCASKHALPVSPEDNPSNHFVQGMNLIDHKQWDTAAQRFDRALALNPDYAPAMAGKALILAHSTESMPNDHKALEMERIHSLLSDGYSTAENDTERFLVATTAIRVETQAQGKNWLSSAERWYAKRNRLPNISEKNLLYYEARTAIDYMMAKAQFAAGKYQQTKTLLTLVINDKTTRWHHTAGKLFAKTHKIERAIAHNTISNVSKAIATKDAITRADVAVLLVNELKLDYLFTKRLTLTEKKTPDYVPADIVNHPLKEEILSVFSWHVRGLEPQFDTSTHAQLFYPSAAITRQEMALALEDLLIKITQDESLATKFIGQENSPFPDVEPTQAAYNAIMNAVTRNLMENDLTGAFRPTKHMDGAELLLAVVRLRNALTQ